MGIIKKKIPCLFHISSHILFILPGDIIAIAGGWDCALKGRPPAVKVFRGTTSVAINNIAMVAWGTMYYTG